MVARRLARAFGTSTVAAGGDALVGLGVFEGAAENHSLSQQALERLGGRTPEERLVVEKALDEARVEEMKHRVLDAAMHTFWRKGYEGTSAQDLVDATGLGRGSLYAAYANKHGIFDAKSG